MLECVPNISEGRDPAIIGQIVDVIARVPRVVVVGFELDADHNRSVITFAGPDASVVEAAVATASQAAALIDITNHQGEHPRVGATDVIPFVPLAGSTMQDAVVAARAAGQALWDRLCIPVYFYENAARVPERRPLQNIRRPGFDGHPPDIGDVAAHPTAGASMVGAREFLVAYNVDLATADVATARKIARRIRASSGMPGSFPYVKAIGLYLPSRKCAQVSMNLVNFAATPLDEVYAAIDSFARELGTHAASGEIIGFVPRAAYEQAPEFFRKAQNFDESRILETHLR